MSGDCGEQGDTARVFFTWRDLLAVGIILAMLAAVLVPAILASREQSRRMSCKNSLKFIGLALHNYSQARKVFPSGTISAYQPTPPGNQYDILSEAAESGTGFYGTSLLLPLFFYIECYTIATGWQLSEGISSTKPGRYERNNFLIAISDCRGFYCPSRRRELRPEDRPMMLLPAWTGGGMDYGGCAGRHAAFTLKTGYNICDASTYYDPNYFPPPFSNTTNDEEQKRWGIFGRVNVGTTFAEIRDGTSNTIMTGELQRFTDVTPISRDGWVIGGPCTLFTTGAMVKVTTSGGAKTVVPVASGGRLMNNKFFGSPGSDHGGGAHFGLADGSVRFIVEGIDPRIFALLGSMADGEEVSVE